MDIARKNLGCRVVVSGNKVEFYEYVKPIYVDFEREHAIERKQTEESKKRADNLLRARKNVRQLIWSNVTAHSKFLTLTYRETMLDVKRFRRDWQTFVQAMRRKGHDLRYLYVIERQKQRGLKEGNEGTIHAHVIVFNDEFIPLEDVLTCWKHGNIDLKMLNGLRVQDGERVKDAGAYVCKYVAKEAVIEWGQRCYNTSHGNLNKPEEVKFYAYGGVDDKGIPNYVTPEFDVFEAFKSMAKITYEDVHDYSYELSDGRIYENAVVYSQGTIKKAKIIEHEEFVEIE